jgi:hypothetical protein
MLTGQQVKRDREEQGRARQEQRDECRQQTGSVRTTYHAKEAKDGSDAEEGGEE